MVKQTVLIRHASTGVHLVLSPVAVLTHDYWQQPVIPLLFSEYWVYHVQRITLNAFYHKYNDIKTIYMHYLKVITGQRLPWHKQTDAFPHAFLTLAPRHWAFFVNGIQLWSCDISDIVFFNCRRIFGYTANQMPMKYRNASVCVRTWKPIVKTRTNMDMLFPHNLNKRARRALGRLPEEKVKGQGEAILLL